MALEALTSRQTGGESSPEPLGISDDADQKQGA